MATENVLATQVTLGLLGAGLLNWLKSRHWIPFINGNTPKLNHVVLLVTSALSGLGLHVAWSSSTHSLTITGLDLATLASAAWIWAKQWAVQFMVHRGAFGAV